MIPQEVLQSRQFYLNQLPEVSEENKIHLERYKRFILSRPVRKFKRNENLNRHHILPKSLRGNNAKENFIILTTREHYIAHLILWKCGYLKMCQAFWYMSHNKKHSNTLSSRQYILLQKDNSHFLSIIFKGVAKSEDHKQKISKGNKGKMSGENHPFYGKQRSKETKEKISKSNIGKIRSEEAKQKMKENHYDCCGENNPMFGKDWREGKTEEELRIHSERISKAGKGKKKPENFGKNMSGGNNHMSRKIRCIETNEIFSCKPEASKKIYKDKKWVQRIKVSLKHKRKVKGYSWEYVD
ncbi:MAG: NUMOD3 domain-containing DNA-binding protein [Vulcanibacillus sp.]